MIVDYCLEFSEDFLMAEDRELKIRIRKVFYADFLNFMRRNGCKLKKVNDKKYYMFLTFEWDSYESFHYGHKLLSSGE